MVRGLDVRTLIMSDHDGWDGRESDCSVLGLRMLYLSQRLHE